MPESKESQALARLQPALDNSVSSLQVPKSALAIRSTPLADHLKMHQYAMHN